MPHPEAEHWNEKYQRESDFWLELQPRDLLKSFSHLVSKEGLGLDAACGVGVNAQFLAQHGLRVIGIDISEFALRLAKERAQDLDISFEAVVADLSNLWLPAEYFEVVINFHFLKRATIPFYRQALKPGGLIMFDTFTTINESTNNPLYYLSRGELLDWFHDFEIIHYAEKVLAPTHNHGERGTAQLVARKPGIEPI